MYVYVEQHVIHCYKYLVYGKYVYYSRIPRKNWSISEANCTYTYIYEKPSSYLISKV